MGTSPQRGEEVKANFILPQSAENKKNIVENKIILIFLAYLSWNLHTVDKSAKIIWQIFSISYTIR